MATLPGANVAITTAAAAIVGTFADLIWVLGPVPTSADATPRLYGSASAVQDQHDYCEAVEYVARHCAETGKAVVFCGVPIATAGAVGREDTSGNTGTSVTTVAAGSDGVLNEHEGRVDVVTGGTIGTDQILLRYSLDGWRTSRLYRLGTGSSFVLPDVGVTMSFAAGTLVAGDTIHTWFGSGPRSDASGWDLAFAAMGQTQRSVKTVILIGDLQNSTEAGAFRDDLNAYKTTRKRAIMGRASVYDRLPLATMSSTTHRATGVFNTTFGDDDPDTITRSTGSFVTDGFAAGDILTISGSTNNNGTLTYAIDTAAALVLTCDASETLTAEGPASGVTIVGEASLTFSDAADTITRAGGTPGSWLTDGFRVGDSVTISDTVSNDGTFTVTAVTATVITFEAGDLADEVIGITTPTISAGQTKAVWMAAADAAFASITGEARISLGAGRGRRVSPLTGWDYRRPVTWTDSILSYTQDLHNATWAKKRGPTGDDLYDSDGNLVEWDDDVDGGAGCAANFTTFRTWSNDGGAFIAQSLTRAGDGSVLQATHDQAVVDLVTNVCQASTEYAVGESLVLKTDGTATEAALREIESRVNGDLEQAIADQGLGYGPRASSVRWTASRDDVLNVAPATMTGICRLVRNGTLHTINTDLQVI